MQTVKKGSLFDTLVISYENLYPKGTQERIDLAKKHISKIGKRVSHSKENIYGWEKNIISSQIDFNRPILLCLGGSGIDKDELANGIAKRAQELIGRKEINDKEVQLLSAVYPKDVQKLGKERKKFKRGEKRNRVDYIYAIYETIFFPIILDTIQNSNSTDEFSSIKSKLRNITILSHCHGTFVACELANYLREDLETYGFAKEKIDDLLSEITNIMLSPRDGVQRCDGPLNIGFTLASDNLEGGITEPKRKGFKISVSDFTDKLISGKINGSESFYFKYGSLHNLWDTDRFGGDIQFIRDYDEDGMSALPSEMIYKEIFMGTHYHLFENYCSITGQFEEEGIGSITKNEKGRNFTKMIARSLQNAISLSAMGTKRTFKEIISNDTELCYRQGSKENNPYFKDVFFNGTIDELKQNYENNIAKSNNSKTNINDLIQNQR